MLTSLLKSTRALPTLVWFAPQRMQLSSGRILTLNNLENIPGAKKKRKRVGRGRGSGLGKMSGRGHQKARSVPRGYEGGQTTMVKRLPKIGFHNSSSRYIEPVSLSTIQDMITMGRLRPKPNDFTTIRDLYASGTINKIPDGVKVVSVTRGGSALTEPIHLEVSQASSAAIAAVEAVGGTVTCVHFNKLAMRALLKPFKFQLLPRRARPQPKLMPYYLDHTRCGFLSPEIQKRNLKMFGAVTSEEKCRQEHTNFMDKWREELRAHRRQLLDDAGMESPVV